MLRDFAPADQEVVRELILEGMRGRWGDRFDPHANPDVDDIWGSYVESGAEVVVAETEAQVVATGTLVRLERRAVRQRPTFRVQLMPIGGPWPCTR